MIFGGARINKQDHPNDVEAGMEVDAKEVTSKSIQLVDLLRRFLGVQQRRAAAYERLRRYSQNNRFRTINEYGGRLEAPA